MTDPEKIYDAIVAKKEKADKIISHIRDAQYNYAKLKSRSLVVRIQVFGQDEFLSIDVSLLNTNKLSQISAEYTIALEKYFQNVMDDRINELIALSEAKEAQR